MDGYDNNTSLHLTDYLCIMAVFLFAVWGKICNFAAVIANYKLMKRQFITMLLFLTAIVVMAKTDSYYLFAYFTDDTTQGQQVKFAVSEDGLHFTPLNGNRPVIGSDTISISGGVRDPHLLRCDDGWFRMVLTDMDMSKGKWSNRGIILLRSHDLIHWEHHTVHFPDRYRGGAPAEANAVWAPQTIYDPTAGKYMVYFSLHSEKGGPYPTDRVYYAYANSDFSDLDTAPQLLFDFDGPAIDTDIVLDEDGLYHLFFNTWGGGKTMRRQYVFRDLHRPATWTLLPGHMQPNEKKSEGSTAYQLADGTWILCYDCFQDKEFQFCQSRDLKTFELVYATDSSDPFNPKHGSCIPITEEEYSRLKNYK